MTRILCLHGAGCNAKILRWQLSPLIRALGPDTDFVFIEGEIPCAAAPGLEGVAPPPFSCYYETVTIRDIAAAHEEIAIVLEEDGPFDGVIGFSQGSALAAGVLLAHSLNKPLERPPWNFAIFFSGTTPFSSDTSLYLDNVESLLSSDESESKQATISAMLDSKEELRQLALSPVEGTPLAATMLEALDADPLSEDSCRPYHAEWTDARINIPTLHVFGESDVFSQQAVSLYNLCSSTERLQVKHPGGHDVPRDEPSITETTKQALKIVERSKLVASGALF